MNYQQIILFYSQYSGIFFQCNFYCKLREISQWSKSHKVKKENIIQDQIV